MHNSLVQDRADLSRRKPSSLRPGVTLADVARAAGVDQSTVSRVLRNDHGARTTEATRSRIHDEASRLGYVANAAARSLAMRRTSTLGILIPSSLNLVIVDVIRGAQDAARELGYVLMVADASELGRASDAVRSLVLEGRVDGLLIASGTITDEVTDDLLDGFGNCVILNRRIGGRAPSVIEDDDLGMFIATRELIEHGHETIACLAGPIDIDTSRRRVAGYRRAMKAAGLKVGKGSVVHRPFDEAGGFSGTTELLSGPNRPSAIASASLAAAIGGLAAARGMNVGVPDELSFTAFHDAPIANYLSPPLTTVAMPLGQLGRQAVLMLHRRLTGVSGPTHVTVQDPAPRLIRRESVARLAKPRLGEPKSAAVLGHPKLLRPTTPEATPAI